jgi:hypothetical protein
LGYHIHTDQRDWVSVSLLSESFLVVMSRIVSRLGAMRPLSAAASSSFLRRMEGELETIRQAGTWKTERVIISPQDAEITIASGKKVLNFCKSLPLDKSLI